jgi:hypothetical protein
MRSWIRFMCIVAPLLSATPTMPAQEVDAEQQLMSK